MTSWLKTYFNQDRFPGEKIIHKSDPEKSSFFYMNGKGETRLFLECTNECLTAIYQSVECVGDDPTPEEIAMCELNAKLELKGKVEVLEKHCNNLTAENGYTFISAESDVIDGDILPVLNAMEEYAQQVLAEYKKENQ